VQTQLRGIKEAGGVAEVVKHLPGKSEALFCLVVRWVGEEREGVGGKWGRNDPNIVCTYE
jgi:hypothetical protein